ncbi:hypothetical protein A6F68_02839 [Tsuneonella dongtanensis]|uniref:Uncharacterized protein n=1 Tax=Tsuneonella dongtanensis TaxID=692370 RepID=A0A1B2AGT9_9SPHN|nr:hypothetical protein [Tsuneonella dongtanensis]ANY21328.1 hypothetical protein A6F68_02839 [Tsuneonella dongtanensis]
MTISEISRAALAASLAILATSSAAKDREPSPYEPCSRIEDNAARLQCFDATYAREEALVAAKESKKREDAVENFGFSEADIEKRERAARPDSAERQASAAVSTETPMDGKAIQATITEVLTDQRGNHVLLLDNGQIWRSTAAKNYRGSVRAGWKVEIKEGKFAGYRLTFEGKTGFLGVERVR